MKFKHKYLEPVMLYLVVYIFGLWLFGFGLGAVRAVYEYLNHLLPNIFPLYNPIYEPEKHLELQNSYTVAAIFIALLLINFIALKFDNKKYEKIISQTDGQYLILDGIKLYFKEFLLSDVFCSLVLPMLLVIPPYFIPEDILGKYGLILITWLGYHMSTVHGLVPAIFTVALFSFAARLISIPECVKSWRAAWLSDI